MTKIYVIKETYDKNANDGISYFTDKYELAEAVYQAEACGAHVEVFKCVPVKFEVYPERISIEFYGEDQ